MKKTIYTIAVVSTVAAIGLFVEVEKMSSRIDGLTDTVQKQRQEATDLASKNSQLQSDLSDAKAKNAQIESKISMRHETMETVLEVLKKEEQCRKSHFDGPGANPSEYKHYISELREIQIDSCPTDFRDAWRDFVNAAEFKSEHPVLFSGVKRSEWPSEKRRDLETLAAKYGVVFRAP